MVELVDVRYADPAGVVIGMVTMVGCTDYGADGGQTRGPRVCLTLNECWVRPHR